MSLNHTHKPRLMLAAVATALCLAWGSSAAEKITILHVGDQESWLLSAQGNLRDNASQGISFYGGVDRLATVMAQASTAAQAAGSHVIKLNAGDAWLPGPRFNASKLNLGSAFSDGGQDYYDAIAMRHIGFDAAVFGNHEFDEGPGTAARFALVSGTTYLSSNLNFNGTPAFAALAGAGTVKPWKEVVTASGHKIALVGATTPLLPRISQPGGINLLGYNPAATDTQNLVSLAGIIQSNVDAARAAGAKTVVLMSHLQNWNNERNVVIPLLKGVDVVLSGGGHELMADTTDALITGGPGREITGVPQMVADAEGKQVAIVTSNFGNRYVGELNMTVDGATGAVNSIDGRMLRVSGAAADSDRVNGDSFLKTAVVDPVQAYVNVLNATRIGSSSVFLNGERGSAGAPGSFTAGVRNAETNLGNLVADAYRHATGAQVALQNGGGIRASIAVGDVTAGSTFNSLPFTNVVQKAQAVNAAQLKTLLEHGVATASASGAVNGRFPQVAGLRIVYDTNRAAGSRVLYVQLEGGKVLIANGAIVDATSTFSMATIDFLEGGGDGYPFAGLGIEFDTGTLLYQETLANYISAPLSEGGLGGDISVLRYGVASPFDEQGRLVDRALNPTVAIPEPGTYALMAMGLALVVGMQRRRQFKR